VVFILNIGQRVVGAVVDGVSDVIKLSSSNLRQAPLLGNSLDTRYILGLGIIDERMIIVVDIEQLMSNQEMALVEAASA
jgi:purine-binding chemotaxis protein CheW